nr:hypothetical protein [Angustibacter aerolatus]
MSGDAAGARLAAVWPARPSRTSSSPWPRPAFAVRCSAGRAAS